MDSWYTPYDSSSSTSGVSGPAVRFTHLDVLASLREARQLGRAYENSTLLRSRWSSSELPGQSCGVGVTHSPLATRETWRNAE